jgi:hypothetical protein
MSGSIVPPKVPAVVSREIELAAAVARERLVEIHLQYLLEFVERARADVPPPRALSIYCRLHRLSPGDAMLLTHRLLVVLGERADPSTADIRNQLDEPLEAPWNSPTSMLARMRRRLRGRVNPELRRWVEVHTGRTQIALLEVHVEHAVRFIDILQSHRSYAAAVEMYATQVNLPAAQVETVYFMALDRLEKRARSEEAKVGTASPTPAERTLRIVEGQS